MTRPTEVSADELLLIIGRQAVEIQVLTRQLAQAVSFRDQVLAPPDGVSNPFEKDILTN